MRVSILFLVGCFAIASAAKTPLISVSKVADLASTSASLTVDLVKFSSNKIEESLTGEPRRIYHQFLVHLDGYMRMVQEWWSTGFVGSQVMNAVGFVTAVLTTNYERVDSLSARILDPVVSEFEKRYPSCSGLLGPSILDRLLLALWLVFFIRFTLRTLFGFVTCPSRRSLGKM
jgi:hypothetical protein